MNIRHTLVLAVSIALFLTGCETPRDELHVDSLMRRHSWPRIQQIAKAEVEKREKPLGWPATAAYLPQDHRKKVWVVGAISEETPPSHAVILTISDDGDVLTYQRYIDGKPFPNPEELPSKGSR
jgi:hypothetical protein